MHFYEDTHEYLFAMDDVEDVPDAEEEYLTYDEEMELFELERWTRDQQFDDEPFSPVFDDDM